MPSVNEEGLKLREIGDRHRNNWMINYDQVNKNTINIIRDNRAKKISYQFNSKNIHPRDMTVTINGQTYKANPATSTEVPIYQGVSENNVFAYFKEITGTTKLPQPKIVPSMKSINGTDGQVWSVVPTEGPFKGSTINLRTFSQSQNQTNAKFTIEIRSAHKTSLGTKAHKLEIKFE